MTDPQPADPDRPTDRAADPTDRPATDRAPVSVDEAAAALGISRNAVHQRRKRGTLRAEHAPDGWRVWLPEHGPTDRPTGSRSATNRPTDRRPTGGGRPTDRAGDPTAAAELAALVADLSQRNADLAAAAAIWQERARMLGERLAALEAGPVAPAGEPEASTATPTDATVLPAPTLAAAAPVGQNPGEHGRPGARSVLRRLWDALGGHG